ncbi:MAG: DNA methylase [Lachnospiraceae bacterium]|jgi:DNA polymerase V
MAENSYIAIDLKSFYASVECAERGLDALDTMLVVADESRTEKTICLAVSPSLKAYGLPGRCRLFEVNEKVREINAERLEKAPGRRFSGESASAAALAADPSLKLSVVIAPPRMSLYMKVSTDIYRIYLKYVAPEDIQVYSVDEVFIDVTHYLGVYRQTPRELAVRMIRDVLARTGITATAGIGTNLYLAKVAMDIVAKHVRADRDGVRIAALNERSYREQLWGHRPITDFWRVGGGTARRLAGVGLYTMGDIARCSAGREGEFYSEELLYRLFGVNAELLIDHAWGWEPCTIADIKAYRPEENSLSTGQVLSEPTGYAQARILVHEMADELTMMLLDRGLETDVVALSIGYDRKSLEDPVTAQHYRGEVKADRYGRTVPKPSEGKESLGGYTSSARKITQAVLAVFDRVMNPDFYARRLNVIAVHVIPESEAGKRRSASFEQMDLFTDYAAREEQKEKENLALEKEKSAQKAVLELKRKFGKNAVLRGMDLQEGANAEERNSRIGGHKA